MQKEQHVSERLDDRDLMTICVQGLLRFAQELDVTQGKDALEKMKALHDLSREITSFWDLDGSIFEAAQ